MAIPFLRKKDEEPQDNFGLPPIPSAPLNVPQFRDLTGRGFESTEALATAQGAGMRPAGPVFPRPGMPPPQMQQQFVPADRLPAGMPAAPVFRPAPSAKTITAEIEEIAEAVVSEKWEKVSKEINDMKKSTDDLSSTVNGMQERMSNLEKKMDMVIQQVLGKVEEYGRGISDVSTELKAMQKVFGTMVPTMTDNIKDLQELVDKAKTKGLKKRRR